MKISFIVPVYNGERYLRACLDSILGQSVQNIEVVAVNNGSIDNSQAVLTDYAAKDTRVRVLNTPNAGGVSAARNLGFREARGDYVWFLDCDDVLLEGSAEKMLHRAEETGADLVAAGFRYLYDENGQTRAVDLPMADNLLEGTTLANAMHFTALGGCKLWRAQMLRENHLQYPPYRIAEDVGFYLCALACCKRVAVMNHPVYDYRIHGSSSVQTATLKALDCIGVFDDVTAFYRTRDVDAAMQNELLFDRMFHYLLWLERLPRMKTKAERRQICTAFEQSRRKQDFSAVKTRTDIMSLVHTFDRRLAWRAWYESNAYAWLYRTARMVKHKLKR